jgi:glucose-1-phosphate cytidylyltransferase
MNVVILAGGLGQRFNSNTEKIPKPLIKINRIPLILYVMCLYSKYNFNEFIICGGYKFNKIHSFFKSIRFKSNGKIYYKIKNKKFYWKVKIINTGLKTSTGGRIKKISKLLNNDISENFIVTYGDCISDINVHRQLSFHKKHKMKATIAAVTTPSRFGIIKIRKNRIYSFKEKPKVNNSWINGGFFIFSKKCLKLFNSSKIVLEEKPMENLIKSKNLMAYKHRGFWQPVDNIKDKKFVEKKLKDGLSLI